MTRDSMILSAAFLAGFAMPALAQQDHQRAESVSGVKVVALSTGGDAVSELRVAGENGALVADQTLMAVVSNVGIGAIANLDGAPRFETGAAAIDGDAFASFSGILSQSLNTGLNSNVQSAVNVAVGGSLVTQAVTAGATR